MISCWFSDTKSHSTHQQKKQTTYYYRRCYTSMVTFESVIVEVNNLLQAFITNS